MSDFLCSPSGQDIRAETPTRDEADLLKSAVAPESTIIIDHNGGMENDLATAKLTLTVGDDTLCFRAPTYPR